MDKKLAFCKCDLDEKEAHKKNENFEFDTKLKLDQKYNTGLLIFGETIWPSIEKIIEE